MSSITDNSINNSNILNEKDSTILFLEEAKQTFFTKDEVKAMLIPLYNYIELLSKTYDIKLDNNLDVTFNKPNFPN